jgi:uncharacterized Zn finger protein
VKKDNTDWSNLCDYVFSEILQYNDDLKFPKYLVLRLRGLANGQFIANKKQKESASYDYKTILITFKYCKSEIITSIKKTEIKDEQHLINLIMYIIEKEINNVAMKLKKAKKANEKTINIELDNQIHDTADYKPKSKNVDKKLEELW